MRSIRRVGGVAVAGLLLSVLATGGQAGAQTAGTPASYTGSATGYALALTLANQGLTAGSSAAKAASTGEAEATGAGVLGQASTTATAKAGETKPEQCGTSALPAAITDALSPLVTLGLGCGSASATGTGLTTAATANGKVATLDVGVTPITGPLFEALPLDDIVGQVTAGLDELCAALPAPLGSTVCTVNNTVTTVTQSIRSSALVGAEVGSSTSGVSVSGETVTTESTASGAIIRIVPTPTLNGVTLPEALATITVARANAKVVCSTGTGTATPSFDPAIVRVKLGAPLSALLEPLGDQATPGLPVSLASLPQNPIIGGTTNPALILKDGEISLVPGSTVTLFPGLPIETTIVVGNGSSKVNPDGSATATADGVRIHALSRIGEVAAPLTGGLLANLAHAEAAGACVAATVATAPPAAPIVPDVTRELPRTGGPDVPWLPLAGAAGLALAVFSRRAVLRTR